MALIFQRLARNFIKNGYFPTDELSLTRILSHIAPAEEHGLIRLLDPCCGEGTALAELAHHLKGLGATVYSAGIEYDKQRAYHAKTLLDTTIHADFEHCVVTKEQFQVLWLNPPYGDRLATHLTEKTSSGRDRLEKVFLKNAISSLSFGGLLIYIIPYYVLDKDLSRQLVRYIKDIEVHRLPEAQFKQIVVTGYRKRVDQVSSGDSEALSLLLAVGEDRLAANELCDSKMPTRRVPICSADTLKRKLEFKTCIPDKDQVAEVVKKNPCLWADFQQLFCRSGVDIRRPCRKLSDWHLSLTLAAGLVSGIVTSPGGRSLLVKGGTYKTKDRVVTQDIDDKGQVTEVVTATDRFVPIIKAIDVTPGDRFGSIITIR